MIGKIFQVIEVKNIAENYIKGEENFDFSPPPSPPLCTPSGGCDPKTSSRFGISIPKPTLNDNIGQKRKKLPCPIPPLPPLYAPRGV